MILCKDFVYLCARPIDASQSEKLGNGTYFGFLLMQKLISTRVLSLSILQRMISIYQYINRCFF